MFPENVPFEQSFKNQEAEGVGMNPIERIRKSECYYSEIQVNKRPIDDFQTQFQLFRMAITSWPTLS